MGRYRGCPGRRRLEERGAARTLIIITATTTAAATTAAALRLLLGDEVEVLGEQRVASQRPVQVAHQRALLRRIEGRVDARLGGDIGRYREMQGRYMGCGRAPWRRAPPRRAAISPRSP